jgi:hypothetical protein
VAVELLADGRFDAQGRQAGADAAVLFDVLGHQAFEHEGTAFAHQAALEEDLAQRLCRPRHRGRQGFAELLAGDEMHLEREQTEHQIAIGVRR